MNVKLRPGTREDSEACGAIDFEAFKSISSEHNFPWDFPSVEIATAAVSAMLANPGFYCVVAEADGKIVGSNFLDERNPISGIGPISVDPAVQNRTIGRQLMRAVMERSAARGFAGCRLVQSAYHNRSLCLYTKLGFDTREPLSKIFGQPPKLKFAGYEVRAATEADVEAVISSARISTGTIATASCATRSNRAALEWSSIWDESPATQPTLPSLRTPSAKATTTSRR